MFVAIGPVLVAWALGFFKLPETTAYLDYSITSSELLQMDSSLRKEVSVLVDQNEVSELYLYSLHFVNNSGRNFGKTKVSLHITPSDDSELISTSFKGPENYSASLINKLESGEKHLIIYELDLINIAGEQSPDYFTANFLFAGGLPLSVIPTTHNSGTEFRPFQDSKNQWFGVLVLVTTVFSYFAFLWWMNKRFDAQFDAKKGEFKLSVESWFSNHFEMDANQCKQFSEAIEAQRKQVFHPPGWIRRKLKQLTSEEAP